MSNNTNTTPKEVLWPIPEIEVVRQISQETTLTGQSAQELFSVSRGDVVIASKNFNPVDALFEAKDIILAKVLGTDPNTGELILIDENKKELRYEYGQVMRREIVEKISKTTRGTALIDTYHVLSDSVMGSKKAMCFYAILSIVLIFFKLPIVAIFFLFLISQNNEKKKTLETARQLILDKFRLYMCYRVVGDKFNFYNDSPEEHNEVIDVILDTIKKSEDMIGFISRFDVSFRKLS